MLRLVPLVVLFLLAACGRPLTQSEQSFASGIYGPALQTGDIRMVDGNMVGWIKKSRPPRPYIACRERIFPPETDTVTTSTAAFVLGEKIYVAKPFFLDDYMEDYPDMLPLARSMLLAHELTHVWQWQNRAVTGYSPILAAAEQVSSADPYLFDVAAEPNFLDFPYEHQAAMVEEFVCCRALDPDGARTARLHGLLSQVFPDIPLQSPARNIALPWSEAQLGGICS